ncbi:MAG: hypothetical protein U5K00_17945 [Melioribacteraceae bacterium]|nr:hypothetical protein [Melioribacteraceae bacterium]
MCRVSDQEYYLSYYDEDYSHNDTATVIYRSTNGGETWEFSNALQNIKTLSLEYSEIDQKVKAAYFVVDEDSNSVITFSKDALVDDIASSSISVAISNHSSPNTKLEITDNDKIWLVYNDLTIYNQEYSHSDVLYLSSEDNGETWLHTKNFTKFVGDDILVSIGKDSIYPIACIISNRAEKQKQIASTSAHRITLSMLLLRFFINFINLKLARKAVQLF